MNNNDVIYRTEDMKPKELASYFVFSDHDTAILKNLKSRTPLLLNGSRGNGKTMLLKKAEVELDESFNEGRILSVFISVKKSNLVSEKYFQQWILTKIILELTKKLKKIVGLSENKILSNFYEGNGVQGHANILDELKEFKKELEKIIKKDENKIHDLSAQIDEDLDITNDIDSFQEMINMVCESNDIDRIILFFDEVCHNFNPNQQREFFSLFRDLRNPYISCKAAVYPGVASYGTFQVFHDAEKIDINRDISSDDYVKNMREIIKRQVKDETYTDLIKQGKLLDALIYSCSGNPRLLLKSLTSATSNFSRPLKDSNVNEVIKNFYRADIWAEHTKISQLYPSLVHFVDWGRNFIEDTVINDTTTKNKDWINKEESKRQTCYFCIHKDAPSEVKKSIEILEYSGIVVLHTEATKVRTQVFNRYAINMGVLVAPSSSPVTDIGTIMKYLSSKLYTDYAMNSPKYGKIPNVSQILTIENEFGETIDRILKNNIEVLDITQFQKTTLKKNGIKTLGELLELEEKGLMDFYQIGEVRSRRIYNNATNAFFEYISG